MDKKILHQIEEKERILHEIKVRHTEEGEKLEEELKKVRTELHNFLKNNK